MRLCLHESWQKCANASGDIVQRQLDEEYDEYKYLVDGPTLEGDEIEIVAKLRADNTVIITAYRL